MNNVLCDASLYSPSNRQKYPLHTEQSSTQRQPDSRLPGTHIAIIGGGISGLSTAWYLQQQAESQGLSLQYTVLEQTGRWGGKIYTETVNGFGSTPFVVEGGPDSFITQKPWALDMIRELGLESRILGTNDHIRKVYVLNKGGLTPLPDGVLLIVPTRFMPFATSPLISPLGKLRMGMELFLPRKKDDGDESLADFVRRRLGKEALDKLAEPLMAGIYNTEAERQSLLATFPRFRALEQKYGSLTRGMLAARRQRSRSLNGLPQRYSVFTSLQSGMQELVEGLLHNLTGDLRLNAGVDRIGNNADGTFTLSLDTNTTIHADAVIVTTPAYVTAALLRPLAPKTSEILAAIRYVSTGTISLAFKNEDVKRPLDGFGIVIPRSERRPVNAVTWSSQKFDHRAPDGFVLMRVFFGGSRTPDTMQLDDKALLDTVRNELHDLMGIQTEPLLHRIYRWHHANPQYDVGHLEQIDAAEAALPSGIYLTGSAYRGIGIPDCVHQSQQIAERAIHDFKVRIPD